MCTDISVYPKIFIWIQKDVVKPLVSFRDALWCHIYSQSGIKFDALLLSWEKHTDSYTLYLFSQKWLEVNKCAFTFSSEIRQIQRTRTEFWCIQCPRPAGKSALDKHQIQASALDLSYFTRKSKCKCINLIHTRQKNKIICSCSSKIINKMVLKCR